MALQQEIWVNDIQEKLFAGAEFVRRSVDHSAFIENKIVHLPQAGNAPTIEKNRASYPATIAQRTDAETIYQLNEYTTDPIHITDVDELQTSYDKRTSVLGSHIDVLNDRIALETAFEWSTDTAASQIVTTGSASSLALAPGATGTRLEITKEDVRTVAALFDRQNVPMNNRVMVLPSDMYYQLFSDTTLISGDYMNRSSLENGVIAQLYGFDIMMRSAVAVFDEATGTYTKKAVGAASAATDSLGALAFQTNSVSNALGDIKVFSDEDKPEYYGSIFSAMLMHGASKLRADEKGVASIVQGV
jgi:hypothetical protein